MRNEVKCGVCPARINGAGKLVRCAIAACFFYAPLSLVANDDPRSTPISNVVLISIDTLRADHLGAYGYRKSVTPNLDQLAGEGIVFEHAYTPVPLTLPAHTSLLTGEYPPKNGVRDNGEALPASAPTLLNVCAKMVSTPRRLSALSCWTAASGWLVDSKIIGVISNCFDTRVKILA